MNGIVYQCTAALKDISNELDGCIPYTPLGLQLVEVLRPAFNSAGGLPNE